MKGDFSRYTYDRTRHYSRVLMQQGRVQLDADWNEEQEIEWHRGVRVTRDEIGGCGVPSSEPGSFKIDIAAGGKDLTIGAGRIYVSGILCENEAAASLLSQPDLPAKTTANPASVAGIWLAYLDVWQRHITALEDPKLREKALGGPDTGTRTKTVWQVKLKRAADRGAAIACSAAALPAMPDMGTLAASVVPSSAAKPCVLPPQTGYRRLENQLYRVEVHTPGKIGEATFKWSRENGSVTAAITGAGGSSTIPVQSTGRDNELGFSQSQWVELLDDSTELSGAPGSLFQVAKVDPAARTVELKVSGAAPAYDPALHPKLRLWNQQGGAEVAGGIPITAAPVQLEDGVQVQFAGAFFATGDHWLIPARTAIDNTVGNIEWPVDGTGNPLAVNPYRVEHRYCALALVDADGAQFLPINGAVQDCRDTFDDLVTLTKRKAAGCCTVVIGPDDLKGNVTLQSLVDQQKGKGRVTVCLKPGIYTLPATLRLDAGHVNFTFEGCPEGAVLRGAADAQAALADGLVCIVNSSNVAFRKLRFELPLSPYPTDAFAKTTVSSVAIRAVDCAGLTVRNCEFVSQHVRDKVTFSVGVMGGGACAGWSIADNRFIGSPVTESPSVALPAIAIGVLIHPGVQGVAGAPAGAQGQPSVIRATLSGGTISNNFFDSLTFSVLTTADSGAVQCSSNKAVRCNEGFWFLSLQALSLLTPDQTVTFDPQYEQELVTLLQLFGVYYQDPNYTRAFLLALYYPLPKGWIAPETATPPAATPPAATTAPAAGTTAQNPTFSRLNNANAVVTAIQKRSTWQVLVDTSVAGIKNVKPGTPTPAQKTVKVSDLIGLRADPAFAFLINAQNLEPQLALSLDFSNNDVDLGTGSDQPGTGVLVVDSDRTTDSVLTMTSNRMRNFSSKSAAASAWAIDRCAITGNIFTNALAAPGTGGKRGVLGPWSLVVVPLAAADAKTPQAYAISGNVCQGTTTLALIPRPFAAPLNTWSFANTEL